MFEAKVYRVAVSTLGAILEEDHIAKETIQAWNNDRAEKAEKLFLTISEGAATTPDLYVVIIDSYVDTTKVEKIVATGCPIVFFFSQYHDPNNSMQVEVDAVEAFKERMKGKYRCVDYRTAREFGEALLSTLDCLFD